MSEVTESTQPAAAKPKRSLLVPLLITAAVVVMLPLIYVGVYFALPLSILSSYQAKNCGLALGLDNLYTGIYPAIIADTSFDGPVHECALYSLATSSQ